MRLKELVFYCNLFGGVLGAFSIGYQVHAGRTGLVAGDLFFVAINLFLVIISR